MRGYFRVSSGWLCLSIASTDCRGSSAGRIPWVGTVALIVWGMCLGWVCPLQSRGGFEQFVDEIGLVAV